MSDWLFFEAARRFRDDSTFCKRKTGALLVKGGDLIAGGCNLCAPPGHEYGDSDFECLRKHVKTGEDYRLCRPIHAEVMACLNIRRDRLSEELAKFASNERPSREDILRAFTAEEKAQLAGATLYVVGHNWVCDDCQHFAAVLGITDIELEDETGKPQPKHLH